jgi:hypothetical protein
MRSKKGLMDTSEIDNMSSEYNPTPLQLLLNRTFDKPFLADTIDDRVRTTEQVARREWKGSFETTNLEIGTEVELLDNWLLQLKNQRLADGGEISQVDGNDLIENLDNDESCGINMKMIDGIMRRGLSVPKDQKNQEALNDQKVQERNAKLLRWRRDLEGELSAYKFDNKKDLAGYGPPKGTPDPNCVSSILESLNNNKNIIVRVICNRMMARIKAGKINIQELDRNKVKQLINSL